MPMRRAGRLLLLPSLLILPLAGCSILTTEKTEPALSAAAVATAIGHIRPSARDTCETQVQVAEQSTKIATLQTGKETVYKPACTPKAPPVVAAPAASAPAAGPPAAKPPAALRKAASAEAWSTPLPIELAQR